MRSVGGAENVHGGRHDHAAWAYRSDAERAAIATRWLADGLSIGQRCLYVADATPEALAAELAGIPDLSSAMAAGAVVVMPSTAAYDLSVPIDPAAQLAMYAGAVDQALSDGYDGVRVAADITPLVRDPSRRRSHLHWEQFADRYIAEHPLAPACLYDSRAIDDIDPIVCVHPLQAPDEPTLAVYATGPHQTAVQGEIDAFRAPVLADILRTLPDGDDVIDLSGVTFIDARGAWTLHAELTELFGSGRELRAVGATPLLRRVWDACGFDNGMFAA